MVDLNIILGSPNLIEDKKGNRFEFIGIRKDFLNSVPVAQELRPKLNNHIPMKLKKGLYSNRFCHLIEDAPCSMSGGMENFTSYTTDKELISNKY